MGCLKLEHIDQKWTPLKVVHSALGSIEKGDVNRLVLKDHLGSVRVEFKDDGTGTAIPTNVTNYYPFGLPWEDDTDTRNNWTYTGQELQRSFDLGLQRFDFRFYDPTIARFIEVDPISSDFAHVSTYNYAENEPVGSIDLWGLQRLRVTSFGGIANTRTSSASGFMQKLATAGAGAKHPIAASNVGQFKSGSTNISSVSSRISRHVALDGNNLSKGIGSERNALRHTIWSGAINQEFGASAAETLTNGHEGIGIAQSASVSMNTPFEGDLSLADDVVDFLNNEIGRTITSEGGDLSILEIGIGALEVFKNEGLFTASVDGNGNVTIQRSQISQEQFDTALRVLHQLSNNGFSADEQNQQN